MYSNSKAFFNSLHGKRAHQLLASRLLDVIDRIDNYHVIESDFDKSATELRTLAHDVLFNEPSKSSIPTFGQAHQQIEQLV